MDFYFAIFKIIVIVMSAIIHEYAHGWMADRLGDPTPQNYGRLTLNPIPHIDLFGSILLPGLLLLSGASIVIGWAKPVPFNPFNLSDRKYGSAKVALAGPASNLLLAVLFGLLIRILTQFYPAWVVINPQFLTSLSIIVFFNILLMIFNLIPIPPLDGSRILSAFLPPNGQMFLAKMERFGMFIVLFFVFFFFQLLSPVIFGIFKVLTGL